MSATATSYPKQAEPIFSSRQDETPERGQVLRVTVFNSDGSHDFEETKIGDYGNFIPAEEISEYEERLTRTLTRRRAAREAEARSAVDGIVVR
jgi:hypothetical protein